MIYDQAWIRDRVIIKEETECWEWNLSTDSNGYGLVSRISSGESLAHRLAYRIFKGSVVGLVVRHACDNPPCCNPDHLIAGTQKENIHDGINKGRIKLTEPWKVTPEVATNIEKQLQAGMSQREVAKMFNISESHLSMIKRGLNVIDNDYSLRLRRIPTETRIAVLNMSREGYAQKDIANHHNISPQSVSNIIIKGR